MAGLRLALAGYKYRPRMHRSHREIETCLESNRSLSAAGTPFFFFVFVFYFSCCCSLHMLSASSWVPRSHQILSDLLFASAASSELAFNVSSAIFHGSIFCLPHQRPSNPRSIEILCLLVPGPSITMPSYLSLALRHLQARACIAELARKTRRNALVQSPNPRAACVAGDQLPIASGPPICSALATDRGGPSHQRTQEILSSGSAPG